MTAAIVDITALIFIAAMLTAVMLIAWRSFARPQHALIWAIAFALATFGWIANLAMQLHAESSHYYHVVASGMDCLFDALIAIGFARRARPRSSSLPLFLAALALIVATLPWAIPHHGIREAIGLSFGGTMLLISASQISTSLRTASLPQRTTALMLVVFAVIDFSTAAAAIGQGATGQGEGAALYGNMLVLFYPLAFIGIGVFAVFLVAADLAENMLRLATSDVLTGVYNRRGFEDAAERAIRNAQRQRQPLSVVVADIDNFKAVNDRHGHHAGDRALKHFAARLERLIRRGDLLGRIGGEEFALLLVNTRAQDAVEVVERIRRDIATMPVEGPVRIAMTASFGITGLRPGDISLTALLTRADRALYRSKLGGRDRVSSSEDLEDPVQGSAP